MEPSPKNSEVTELLIRYRGGDSAALNEIVPLVYAELRRIAKSQLRGNTSQTLRPTVLVHEAYEKLIDQRQNDWKNRNHFFALSAQIMRRIVIDNARARKAEKRGGGGIKVSFDENLHTRNQEDEVLRIDEALNRLEKLSSRQKTIVEMRYFAGMSLEEIAEQMEMSLSTVKRDWTLAKSFLAKEMAV